MRTDSCMYTIHLQTEMGSENQSDQLDHYLRAALQSKWAIEKKHVKKINFVAN